MALRPLSAILTDLSAIVKTLAAQHAPPIPFDLEFFMSDHALQSGVESQMFRALEVLVLSAHASGLTKEATPQQIPVYIEAVQVLQMSAKQLPADLL